MLHVALGRRAEVKICTKEGLKKDWNLVLNFNNAELIIYGRVCVYVFAHIYMHIWMQLLLILLV